jgi:hypothetical protein
VKKAEILDEIWRSLLDEPEEIIKGLTPVFKSFISQGYQDYQFEDAEIEDLLKERVTKMVASSPEEEGEPELPVDLQPPRGRRMKIKEETFEFRNSFDIVVNTANWLIKNGKLKASDCPVQIGRSKKYLINRESKHSPTMAFRAPKQLSNGLWIEAHNSTAGHINCARRLLEKFGVSSDLLTIP